MNEKVIAAVRDVSFYILLRELLYDGKAGLIDGAQPVDPQRIVDELTLRTGKDFSFDKQKWIDWYVNDCSEGTKIEKDSLVLTCRIILAEEKFASSGKQPS